MLMRVDEIDDMDIEGLMINRHIGLARPDQQFLIGDDPFARAQLIGAPRLNQNPLDLNAFDDRGYNQQLRAVLG